MLFLLLVAARWPLHCIAVCFRLLALRKSLLMPLPAAAHFERLKSLLALEATAEVERIRSLSGPEAEKAGLAICELIVRDERFAVGGRTKYIFGKRHYRLLPFTRLQAGTPVVVTEERMAGQPDQAHFRGVVAGRDRDSIEVVFDEPPEFEAEHPTVRVDQSSDEISRQRIERALQKVVGVERGRVAELRAIMLGEREPRFVTLKPFEPFSETLNEPQRAAIELALAAEDVAVIHGPPGTGKTTTVVEFIRQAIRRGEKVLACAPSNLAVDNLCERLIAAGENVLRLGHPLRVLPEVQSRTLDVLLVNHPDQKMANDLRDNSRVLWKRLGRWYRVKPTPTERKKLRDDIRELKADAARLEVKAIAHLFESASVVCATLTGLDPEVLGDRLFDVAVIDEAAQSIEPASWTAIVRARRTVLAGDHCQLPATVISQEAQRAGLGTSLMQRLLETPQMATQIARRLTVQYRMHESIMSFSSQQFYEGSLIADASVAGHRLCDLPGIAASELTETPLLFIDTAGASFDEEVGTDGQSRSNPREAEIALRQVTELLDAGLAASDIAVITPYAGQVRLLRELMPDNGVEIDTVDGFQGREKEAVVISLVRSNDRNEIGFLSDARRMNVALTRARRKLIVIGDTATLAAHPFFEHLLNHFQQQAAYRSVWEIGLE